MASLRGTLLVSALLFLGISAALANDRTRLEAGFPLSLPSHLSIRNDLAVDKEEVSIVLSIALKNQNLDTLSSFVAAVSDPRSASYGKYLTWEEVGEMVAPSPASLARVGRWLRSNGVDDVTSEGTGDFLAITLTIAEAERLLDTTFVAISRDTTSPRVFYRSLTPYSVPSAVADDILFVGGVYGFSSLRPSAVTVATAAVDDVTPAVLKQWTSSTGVEGSAANNSMAVAEFLEQYYSPTDLATFQANYDLIVEDASVVDGFNNATLPGLEAQLDIEYIMAAGQNIDTWFVSTPGLYEGQEPFLTWLQNMEATPNAPWIFSVSFGDVESTISPDYASKCDVEFEKFGATGRTIFFASGDDGVGCSGCSASPTQEPNWPATSEFVTAVGGVKLVDGALEGDSIATGGFSNLFPMPEWQMNAVSAYIENNAMPQGEAYNVNGRAVPDIALFSEGVQIVIKGFTMPIGGTSCAAPMVAGIFALINDARLSAGMPTMGFVNPWLYQLGQSSPDAFVDVTAGINSHLCCTGFEAASGWDPITGWGIPNYATMVQYALAM